MKRRDFILGTLGISSIGLLGCGREPAHKLASENSEEPIKKLQDMQTYAFYQAFYGSQTIKDLRANGDGTSYKMPILNASKVYKGEEIIDREFWHSHNQIHKFSILKDDYAKLLQGETVYKFTTAANDHWHCVKIVPKFG